MSLEIVTFFIFIVIFLQKYLDIKKLCCIFVASNYIIRNNMNVNDFEFESGSLDDLLDGSQADQNDYNEPDDQNVVDDEPSWVDSNTYSDNDKDDSDDNYSSTDSDVLTEFLKNYGVENGKITYENDNGDTEEVNFNELDSAEQLNILKELTTPNLSQNEIDTINFLRQHNVTFQDAVEYYSRIAVENFIRTNGPVPKDYAIDEYTDDELYFADLKAKYPNMTDEEIQSDVEAAKENEELFKKKADSIRSQYKANEDERARYYQQQQAEQMKAYDNAIKQSITNFNEISLDYKDSKADSLVIDNKMKNDVYRYIMQVDESGVSQFAKDLQDPNILVKIAWLALNADDAISDITNYWKNELKTSRRGETQKPRQQQSQTTVRKVDNKRKEITDYHRNSVDFVGGENLL